MSKQFESAYDEIIETIDYNEAKQIVDYGCKSGVCSQYIYYADTIRFFDNYEEEITDYIITNFGTEFLSNIFLANDCQLKMYKNDVTWCYIELICSQIVEEYESTTLEELSDDSYNPERSMTDTRYALAWLQSLSLFLSLFFFIYSWRIQSIIVKILSLSVSFG